MTEIISKNIEDINSLYDFSESIISSFSWDIPKNDFILCVLYNWNEPHELKNQDVVLRFVNCETANINLKKIIENAEKFSIQTPWQEILSIDWQKQDDKINLTISSNIDTSFIKIICDEVWIERDSYIGRLK